MTNILGVTVFGRGISRFYSRGLSRSQTNQRRANKRHAMDKTPTIPQGGCTLRPLRIFFFLLTVSFPFGRLLLSPPVLDVVSLGRPLPPLWLVAHKGLVASPHMGHGMADVGIHDDADGDIGKWSGWSRSEDSCRILPIYIWNYSICNFGDYSWNRLFKNPLYYFAVSKKTFQDPGMSVATHRKRWQSALCSFF